jgi:hypothetical protein
MRKFLLLLLTIGFFAKPTFAQETTASASSPYLCQGGDLFLYYTGGISSSVWEFFNDGTGTWESLGSADQPLNLKGIITMYAEQAIVFRVKSPDGGSYVFSNIVQVIGGESLGGANVAQIDGDYYKCPADNAATTLTLSGGFGNHNILWSTGETTLSINVDPTTTTGYSMTSTDGQGCVTTATHTITVLPPISPLIQTTSSGQVCIGGPVTLSFGGFSTASPCTLSPNGQNPATAITPQPDGIFHDVIEDAHFGEYSIINVDEGKVYSFFSRHDAGYNSTITSADGSQVYTSGGYGTTVWRANYTGQVRFYSHHPDCTPDNSGLVNRSIQCWPDASVFGYLWMPGGETTPSITVNPQSTTNYTLTMSGGYINLYAFGCPGSATKQITVVPCSTLSATCSSNNPELYFGYSGDQTSTITVTPSGGVAPYTVKITMNRPLKCNQVNDAGDEVWAGGSGGTTINNGCPVYPGLATLAPVSSKTISSGSYSITATLMDDADVIDTVTDATGAVYTCTTYIHGEDVRCFAGKSGNAKVTLCHQTGSSKNPCIAMCVDESDVPAHLAHGDFLGKCTADCKPPKTLSSTFSSISIANPANSTKALKLYPNPNKGQFVVELNIADKINANAKIQLIDITGKTVHSENAVMYNGALQKAITVSSTLAKGMYMVRIVVNNNTYRTPLVYEK